MSSIQAVILVCVLFADVMLDVITAVRAHHAWPTWGLVVRFVCGFAYITLFLIYVGLGDAFPRGYTYWGLPPHLAAPVVYILLCVVAYVSSSSSSKPINNTSQLTATPSTDSGTSYTSPSAATASTSSPSNPPPPSHPNPPFHQPPPPLPIPPTPTEQASSTPASPRPTPRPRRSP